MGYIQQVAAESLRLTDSENWWKELLGQGEGYEPLDLREMDNEGFVRDDFDYKAASKRLPWGDSYIADEVGNRFSEYLSYEIEAKTWRIWNGRVHTPMYNDAIAMEICDTFYRSYERALDYVQEWLRLEGERVIREQTGKDARKVREQYSKLWASTFNQQRKMRDKMRTGNGREALLSDLKREVSIDPTDFIDDTKWFVFRNGVINCDDLRHNPNSQLKILPHDPKRKVERYFDADYRGPNETGAWRPFLESSIPDAEVREYVQAALGAAFSGQKKLRSYLIFFGQPSSGKSLFLETLGALGKGGSGYVLSNAPSDSITKLRGGKNFSRAMFGNNRVIGVSEPDSSAPFDSEFIKEFTGDVDVSLEAKYGQPGPVVAQGLLIIATNELPRLPATDDALMKRTKIVHFPFSFMPPLGDMDIDSKPRDNNLGEKLLDSRSEILNWIIEGMMMFYDEYQSLENSAPASMDELILEYKNDSITSVRWLEEMIDSGQIRYISDVEELDARSARESLKVSDARNAYIEWLRDYNPDQTPMSMKKFTSTICNQYGLREYPAPVRSNGMRFKFLFPQPSFQHVTG